MKRFAVIMLLCMAVPAFGQQYQVPEISVSKDKVRVDGKSYYAHVVTAKQTLYSIAKVYGVSLQDIYDANRNLDLESKGLKAGQVLLIPVVAAAKTAEAQQGGASAVASEGETQKQPKTQHPPVENVGGASKSAENDSAPTTASSEAPAAEAPAAESPTADEQDDRSLFPKLRELLETLASTPGEDSTFVADIPEVINVSILLPFGAGSMADSKSVDFYSGALLAARDLGNKGIRMEINAYDIAGGKLTYSMVNNADVVLGPVSEADVMAAARMANVGRYVISPLEPRTAGMADTLRVIQAPTPARAQAEDAVRWAISDMAPGDSLVLIREKGKTPGETAMALIKALQESGRRYSTISYDLLDGLQIQPVFVDKSSPNGTTRYLIASDEESFVNDAVRNINLMAYKKQAVALYGPSRLRSYATIETENLHNVCSHVSTTYQTDYMSPSVQAFIMAYRALYGAEPNQFAFHGYDCLTYFVTMCSRYGRNWFQRLPAEGGHGLQTDFSFGLAPRAGQVNQAVRRVVYTPEFETVLQ